VRLQILKIWQRYLSGTGGYRDYGVRMWTTKIKEGEKTEAQQGAGGSVGV